MQLTLLGFAKVIKVAKVRLNHKLVQETTICTKTHRFSRVFGCVRSGLDRWILAESNVSKLSSCANINHESPIFSRMFCLGCAADLSEKQADRRAISSHEDILSLWRGFVSESDVCPSDLLRDHCYMCRNCFSAYSRYLLLQKKMTDKVQQLLEILPQYGHKRQRLDPVCSMQPSASIATIPEVSPTAAPPTVSPPAHSVSHATHTSPSETATSPDVGVIQTLVFKLELSTCSKNYFLNKI